MVKQKNLKINMILSAISSIMSIIVPIITFPYFSRILMPEGLGVYSFLSSFVNYFYVFAVLGISTYGTICCSRVRDDKVQLSKTASELFLINILLSLVSYSVLFVLTFFINKLHDNWSYVLIIALSSITTVLNLNWLLQANEEYVFSTLRGMITNVITIVLLFIFVRDQDDLFWYIYINMGLSVLSNIINFLYAKRYIKFNFRGGLNLKRHIKPVLLYFAISLATSVFMDIDKTLLGFMCGDMGDYYVGIYEACSKINRVLITVITGTVGVLCPRMSYLVSNNKMEEFHGMMRKALTYVFLLSISAVIFISFFGRDVVLALLGEAYVDSIIPMQVLLPVVMVKSITNITNMYLMAKGKEKHMTIALAIGAVINIIINVILIPNYNVLGVVIGTVISELFVMIYQLVAIKEFIKNIFRSFKWLMILELLAVTILTMYVCYKFIHINMYVNILIAGCIFLVELFLIMLINKDEVLMTVLNKIFRRKKDVLDESEKKDN